MRRRDFPFFNIDILRQFEVSVYESCSHISNHTSFQNIQHNKSLKSAINMQFSQMLHRVENEEEMNFKSNLSELYHLLQKFSWQFKYEKSKLIL